MNLHLHLFNIYRVRHYLLPTYYKYICAYMSGIRPFHVYDIRHGLERLGQAGVKLGCENARRNGDTVEPRPRRVVLSLRVFVLSLALFLR